MTTDTQGIIYLEFLKELLEAHIEVLTGKVIDLDKDEDDD